ncbi:hypothetical protein CLOM_g17536 [Closterium sp. NIES-68]|nr:hypothetical protein CLOM_g16967 [Closterium sp. NIES-68]GJP32965.1 hypothetical protein CLOM_g17536 [Closterium sp. NIES-68]GJP86459.1 hypothetical protein CLOP_g16484 [Closterium sp. NIES-67]
MQKEQQHDPNVLNPVKIPSGGGSRPSVGVDHEILGIDIGGTSIKAAPVDTRTGKLLAERFVVLTPNPATPGACADAVNQCAEHFQWKGAVGIGVPAVVKDGTTWTAANIDSSWVGADVEGLFSRVTGLPVTVVNDADAAGYAELGFGAGSGENERGVVFIVTFGTGIGTAMFVDGILVPNLELGHMEVDGVEAEAAAAGVLVERNNWTWQQWADKVTWYLAHIEKLFWPSRFIVGGGVSNAHEQWLHLVRLPKGTPILPACMKNDAGIIGAAMASLARSVFAIRHKPQQVEEYIQA